VSAFEASTAPFDFFILCDLYPIQFPQCEVCESIPITTRVVGLKGTVLLHERAACITAGFNCALEFAMLHRRSAGFCSYSIAADVWELADVVLIVILNRWHNGGFALHVAGSWFDEVSGFSAF
jgi:hypothetical protein